MDSFSLNWSLGIVFEGNIECWLVLWRRSNKNWSGSKPFSSAGYQSYVSESSRLNILHNNIEKNINRDSIFFTLVLQTTRLIYIYNNFKIVCRKLILWRRGFGLKGRAMGGAIPEDKRKRVVRQMRRNLRRRRMTTLLNNGPLPPSIMGSVYNIVIFRGPKWKIKTPLFYLFFYLIKSCRQADFHA